LGLPQLEHLPPSSPRCLWRLRVLSRHDVLGECLLQHVLGARLSVLIVVVVVISPLCFCVCVGGLCVCVALFSGQLHPFWCKKKTHRHEMFTTSSCNLSKMRVLTICRPIFFKKKDIRPDRPSPHTANPLSENTTGPGLRDVVCSPKMSGGLCSLLWISM